MPDLWRIPVASSKVPDLWRTPVVIISIVADRNKDFALGAAAVVQKPLSRQELYESLVDLGRPTRIAFRSWWSPPKRITAEDHAKLNGYVTAIMEKAELDRDRFTA